ncbi:unnamed protein product [Heterobilharzia americana]|nr:unnamed protein product [Heterobilharzia americana]
MKSEKASQSIELNKLGFYLLKDIFENSKHGRQIMKKKQGEIYTTHNCYNTFVCKVTLLTCIILKCPP